MSQGWLRGNHVSAAVAAQTSSWAWDLGGNQQRHPSFAMLEGTYLVCRCHPNY